MAGVYYYCCWCFSSLILMFWYFLITSIMPQPAQIRQAKHLIQWFWMHCLLRGDHNHLFCLQTTETFKQQEAAALCCEGSDRSVHSCIGWHEQGNAYFKELLNRESNSRLCLPAHLTWLQHHSMHPIPKVHSNLMLILECGKLFFFYAKRNTVFTGIASETFNLHVVRRVTLKGKFLV